MRPITVLLALLALFATPVAAAESRRYFGDWLAACRDDGYCSAIAYDNLNPGDGRVSDNWFRIGRHAEEIWWELSFTPIAQLASPDQAFSISVDGASERFSGAAEIAAFGSVNDFFLLGPKAQAVMDRLMPGSALEVEFTTETGDPAKARFSLRGLTAALIWIDETQARLGSERVAEAPPIGLVAVAPMAAPPSGERTLDALPADLIALDAGRPDACDGFDIVRFPFYAYPLGENRTLFLLPCSGGAYNRFYSVYVGDGMTYERLDFATPSYRAGWQAEAGIWLERFDPTTLELRSANLGRGLGDCGMRGHWRWNGSMFVMLEYRLQAECDESVAPGEFPVIYTNPDTALPR
jgi:hypothetical protein